MKQKGLGLNHDKTAFTAYGSKKKIENMRREVEKNPIMCGDFVTKEKLMDKWLGDLFVGGQTLGPSVTATIRERMGMARVGCMEILTIVQDLRGQAAGGILV